MRGLDKLDHPGSLDHPVSHPFHLTHSRLVSS
jgi:hypothetical protein